MTFRNSEWDIDARGQREFHTEIVGSSEERFRLCFWHQELVSGQPNGGPSAYVDASKYIGAFTPRKQVIGHNYTLSLRLLVQDGTIRIGNEQEGWCESTPFTEPDEESSWKLVDTNVGNFSTILGMNVEAAVGQWIFAPRQPQENLCAERKVLTIWVKFADSP